MKPSQFAKGFQARPDITTSEKRTALDRLNAIEGLVKSEASTPAVPASKSSKKNIPVTIVETPPTTDPIDESSQYRTWRIENRYQPGQVIELPLKAIKPSPFNPRHFYLKSSIAELAVNLAKQGQQQAIHVIPDLRQPRLVLRQRRRPPRPCTEGSEQGIGQGDRHRPADRHSKLQARLRPQRPT